MSKAQQLYGKPWGESEYIIVLDAYLSHEGTWYSPDDDEIKNLARLLGRTPASIVMRMENYASIDPAQEEARKGLFHISPLGRKQASRGACAGG